MVINEDAPVVLEHHIEIFAPPDKVWDRLSRIDLWDEWRNDIFGSRRVSGDGEGAVFKWRHRRVVPVTATITEWKSLRSIAWEARPLGARLVQVISLSGDFRKTVVHARASLEGRAATIPVLGSIMESQLNRTNEIWLGSLKTRLEYGMGETGDPPAETQPRPRPR